MKSIHDKLNVSNAIQIAILMPKKGIQSNQKIGTILRSHAGNNHKFEGGTHSEESDVCYTFNFNAIQSHS